MRAGRRVSRLGALVGGVVWASSAFAFDDLPDTWVQQCDPIVPTLSTWGFLVLSLALLLVGAILLRRRTRDLASDSTS